MNFSYKISRQALRGLFTLTGWEINGLDNIPQDGPLIIVSNHISNFDPPVVAATLARKVHYMGKEELFDNFFLDKLFRSYGAFPIKRGKGDMGAIKRALGILKDGKVLGLFPEGTRSKPGKLRRAKRGAVMIALKAEVPLVPIGLQGTNDIFKEKIKVNIGKPFSLKEYYGKNLDKKEMREVGKEIMAKIEELL